jgi:hypothetical protein
MTDREHHIRTVMSFRCTDTEIINQWLECQPSALTRSGYARDVNRLCAHSPKSLNQIRLGDLLSFAQSLSEAGLAPVSRASHARGREELVRILPAHGLHRERSSHGIAAAALREPTRGKDDRRSRCRTLAVRGGVGPRSRGSGPAVFPRPMSIRSL